MARKIRIKKKIAKRKKPSPLVGTVKGQKGTFRVSGSTLNIKRMQDRIVVKRPPKKQRVIYK